MRFLLALLVGLMAQSAMANTENGSEYQWQTPAGKWEATPSLSYITFTQKPKGGGGDAKSTGMMFSVRGEYGINEMISGGLVLSHQNIKTEFGGGDSTTSGLLDPTLFVSARSAVGSGSLRYGLNLNVGLGDMETDASGDSNAAMGGTSVAPFVGYEMGNDKCKYGARLSYLMYLGDRKHDDNGATEKGSKGAMTELGLFYEHNMSPVILGVALEIEATEKTEWKDDTGAKTKEAPGTQTGLRVYVPYVINDMITLLPELKYTKATTMDTTAVDSASGFDINVAGRFNF